VPGRDHLGPVGGQARDRAAVPRLVKPERTTSATTGFTSSCSGKIVMHAVCLVPGAPGNLPSMRAVVQRVSRASVAVDGEVKGAIEEPGLLVLVGVTHDDTPEQAARLAAKLWGLRILDGEKSCSDVAAPLLVISQFTLYADLAKGRRPSWSAAAPGPVAEPLVSAVVQALRDLGARVETGVFGADMKVLPGQRRPRHHHRRPLSRGSRR
jgi:D-tyrosyl-tRNA(Tyr) deacylase